MSITYVDGQIDQVRAEASQVQVEHGRIIAGINADPALSPEGKQLRLTEINDSIKTNLESLKAREMKLVENEITRLERLLDAKAGNTSSDIIAFRDAQDRAERIENADEANRIIERAERTGDKTLAHAVFRYALENNWSTTTKAYAKANPELAEAANDLSIWKRFQKPDMNRALAYSTAWK